MAAYRYANRHFRRPGLSWPRTTLSKYSFFILSETRVRGRKTSERIKSLMTVESLDTSEISVAFSAVD